MSNSTTLDADKKRERWLEFMQQLNPEARPETIRLVGLLHRVGHALYQLAENSLAKTGLSYAQYRLLTQLLFHEQCEHGTALNPSELSERQGVSRNTISALIRNLEAEGLVERALDEQDRRRFLIRLTEAGRQRVHNHATHHFHILHAGFSTLSPAEQAELSSLLERLADNPAFKNRGT